MINRGSNRPGMRNDRQQPENRFALALYLSQTAFFCAERAFWNGCSGSPADQGRR